MVWYGMVWHGMVWYGMVWYGMVWSVQGNLSILMSAYNLRTTPNWTLKRIRSWSPGLREQDIIGVGKIETSILNQVSYGWSPKTQHNIWPKSAQNRPLCTQWISVEISFFVKFWMKFDVWNCKGKRFPPCFFKSCRWVSRKWKLRMPFRTRFLACMFVFFPF